MGAIIQSRRIGDNILYKVIYNQEDALSLKGILKNIQLFSLDLCKMKGEIMQRGKHGVTKFFLIPTQFKSKSKKKPKSVSYQSIDLDTKMLFIYTVNK